MKTIKFIADGLLVASFLMLTIYCYMWVVAVGDADSMHHRAAVERGVW